MTESKKKTFMKLCLILIALTAACLVLVGAGAANMENNKITDPVTLEYYTSDWTKSTSFLIFSSYSFESKKVTKTVQPSEFAKFFGTTNVYWIHDVNDLVEVAELTSNPDSDYEDWRWAAYILDNDIDCSSVDNMPSIGVLSSWKTWTYFNGSIWGNGHTIYNFKQEGDDACGLIARAGRYSRYSTGHLEINNLNMKNCYIHNTSGNDGVGALCGCVYNASTMTNVLEKIWRDIGQSLTTEKLSDNNSPRILGCNVENATILSDDNYVGGLAGQVYNSTLIVANCSVTQSKIFSEDPDVGGLIGGVDSSFLIKAKNNINDFRKGANNTDNYGGVAFYNSTVEQCKIGSYDQNVGGAAGTPGVVTLLPSESMPQGVTVKNCLIESRNGDSGGLFGYVSKIIGGTSTSGWIIKDNYFSVEDTAVVASDTCMGVIAGDIYKNFESSVSGEDKSLLAKNIVLGGTGKVTIYGPGNTTDYKGKGNYIVRNSKNKTSSSSFGMEYKSENGNVLATTYDDFRKSLLKSEFENGSGTISSVWSGNENFVDLKQYGTEDGYGYITGYSVPVTFAQSSGSSVADSPEPVLASAASNITYTIRFDANGTGTTIVPTGSMEDMTDVPAGTFVLLTENEFEDSTGDYEFYEWNTKADGSGDWYSDRAAFTQNPTIEGTTYTLYAQWKPEYIWLTFVSSQGSVPSKQMILNGATYTRPETPVATGYTFGGWYTDETYTNEFDFASTQIRDMTAYAKWTEKTYTFTFDGNGGTGDNPSDVTGKYSDTSVTLPDNPYTKEGYTFTGWNTDKDGNGTYYTAGVNQLNGLSGEITLYAQWQASGDDHIYLSFNMNGRGDQIAKEQYTSGQTFVNPDRTVPSSPGAEFAGWYSDAGLTTEYVFDEAKTKSETAYAKWNNVEGVYVWDDGNSRYVNVEDADELAESSLASTVSYDTETKTLKLNGYSANPDEIPEDFYGAIYSSLEDKITIELVSGSRNSIGTEVTGVYVGIYADPGSIVITGDGELIINVIGSASVPGVMGIYSWKDLTVNGGTITVTADCGDTGIMELGLSAIENVTINDGTITVQVAHNTDERFYDIYGKTVTVNGGNITTDGGITAIYSSNGNFTMNGGSLTIDNDISGIVAVGAYVMTGGTVNITSEEVPLLATLEMELTDLKNGSITLNGKEDSALRIGTYLNESGNLKLYAGDSKENTEEWTADEVLSLKSRYVYIGAEETPTRNSSSVTSFNGSSVTRNGDVFTFERAVVVKQATLPGAESATIVNTSGDGWYNFELTAPGFTGNGSMMIDVPQDEIEIRGYTTGDVGLYHKINGEWVLEPTYLLSSDSKTATYKGTFDSCSPFKIDFEEGATITEAAETKPVTETPATTQEPVKTVETPVTETPAATEKPVTTETQTAAKSPFPVLGILAGLGAAAFFLKRRH